MRTWIVLWLVSLALVAGFTSALMRAQAPNARVVSGADLGFRIDAQNQDGEPLGRFVIRVDGKWVPVASFPMNYRPVK
jgi:hypothetical protein